MFKIYALYDYEDRILGCYDRQELKELLNTTSRSFDCIVSRLNRGLIKGIYYKGQKYTVYVFEGE